MGKVAKQSFFNSINSYLGVVLGAFNTMFFFPRVFIDQPEFVGEITTLLAAATVVSTFAHLGFPVSLVTFFPRLSKEQQQSFWSLALFACIGASLIMLVAGFSLYQLNSFLLGPIGYVLLLSISMLFFELFAALSQYSNKVVFPQFIKNTFRRIIILVALIFAALNEQSQELFYLILSIGYLLQLLAVILYSIPQLPGFSFNWGNLNLKEILGYGMLIMLASGSMLLVSRLDILMIRSFLGKAPVAFYNIAFFTGTIVSVPPKALMVSIRPYLSKAWARNDMNEVSQLYRKSALTQLAISGFIFMLIWVNLDLSLFVIPESFQFDAFAGVVLCIGISEMVNSATGSNGLILSISNRQAYNFYTGLFLIVVTLLGNLALIPSMGLLGAALGSLIALTSYNIIKLILAHRFFQLVPYSKTFWKLLTVISLSIIGLSLLKMLALPLLGFLAIGNLLIFILFIVLFKFTDTLDDFKQIRIPGINSKSKN
ncbi:polysaccharide biosynthesis C-terminal domain-containing protein [Croceimicrobium hydrocarbonivorans]|uniref:Polysaccharide biosynthesis C-terminal domain-containing protein n=1 Tax=Croceimicrobium hydrocarbonivorans TaxID=2761580 RepID=A0A7H0VGC6_9FLAO|nr:polysaccharide biosynthesis C-terminal domain-containing protein [Croceimicrobium hydrocarbonivorans]QNR24774.1 polysaccharide biosynthesis C-terminal domain-containing protein [Croceimicrobium hydrocarbonivorans]